MKINFKAILAVVIAVLAVVWAVSSVQQQSYTGTDLTFGIGSGTVAINNVSDASSEARLTSTGTRGAFTVTSSAAEAPILAVREGSGRNLVYVATLELPPGITEINLTRGSNVNMEITGGNQMEVTVTPQSPSEQSTTLLVAAVVVVAAIAYTLFSSRQTWMGMLRGGSGRTDTTGASGTASA
ncbi:MAG: hypothetical protein IAE80_27160 [Anaerolinea sp.]|nr:hypothetical protein [Anaerolinea sp.]